MRFENNTFDHGDDWAGFKSWLDGTYSTLPLAWCEDKNTYTVVIRDGAFTRMVGLNKGSDEATDFEANWKATTANVMPQPVTLEPTGALQYTMQILGGKFDATLDADTNHDIVWAEDRQMQGASFWIENFSDGDYMEMMGVHPVYGEVPPFFGKNVYVPPTGQITVTAEGTKPVPAGIIIRIRYHSVATSGSQPKVTFHLRTWL